MTGHPLTQGRGPDEQVRRVATFAGSAFRCRQEFQPLLILGKGYRSWMPEKYNKFPPGTPSIDVSGWYQGGVKTNGKGRVKFGMNHPLGQDNPRLLLNILHWLSDPLEWP